MVYLFIKLSKNKEGKTIRKKVNNIVEDSFFVFKQRMFPFFVFFLNEEAMKKKKEKKDMQKRKERHAKKKRALKKTRKGNQTLLCFNNPF